MKTNFLIFASLLPLIFLINSASALIIADAQWENGVQSLTITQGESASFDVYFTTYDYPMQISVKLYDLGNHIRQTFIDDSTEDYFFEHSYTISNLEAGDYQIVISGTDKKGQTDSYTLSLNIEEKEIPTPINNAPVITSTAVRSVNEGQKYTYQFTATDADGDVLTYSFLPVGSWLSMNSNGLITGIAPNVDKDSTYTAKAMVTDGKATRMQEYSVTVRNIPEEPSEKNNAPVITSTPVTQVNEKESYSYQVTATDADNDVLTYSLTNSPSWLSINSATGLISGTAPSVSSNQAYLIKMRVSDGEDYIEQAYALIVKNAGGEIPTNHAPVASGQNLEVPRNSLGEIITLSATDSDGDKLTYSITSNPSKGVISEFNSLTGVLVYTPNRDFDGEDSFTFKASDGKSNSNIAKISMIVDGINTPTNHAPVITSSPTTRVNENSAYSYQVIATDADNDVLTYSIIKGPSWLSIDPNTGRVTGTSQEISKDSSWEIIIKVSDGKGFVTQRYFLTVKDTSTEPTKPENNAPVITTLEIPNVNEGEIYSYQIIATDADGDSLTYSLTANPGWLTIDPNTGLITSRGTAPEVSADKFYSAQVSVTDGKVTKKQSYLFQVLDVKENGENSDNKIIILGRGKDKKQSTSLIQFDDFYTDKYMDQFDNIITLDEQETINEDVTGTNLKNILFVLVSLITIVIIISLVTVLFRKL